MYSEISPFQKKSSKKQFLIAKNQTTKTSYSNENLPISLLLFFV